MVERHLFLSYPPQLHYLTIRGFTEPKVVRTGFEPVCLIILHTWRYTRHIIKLTCVYQFRHLTILILLPTCQWTLILSILYLKIRTNSILSKLFFQFVVRTGFEPVLGDTFATAHSDANFSWLRCLSISIDLVLTYQWTGIGTCPKPRLGSQDRIRTCNFFRPNLQPYLSTQCRCVYQFRHLTILLKWQRL